MASFDDVNLTFRKAETCIEVGNSRTLRVDESYRSRVWIMT